MSPAHTTISAFFGPVGKISRGPKMFFSKWERKWEKSERDSSNFPSGAPFTKMLSIVADWASEIVGTQHHVRLHRSREVFGITIAQKPHGREKERDPHLIFLTGIVRLTGCMFLYRSHRGERCLVSLVAYVSPHSLARVSEVVCITWKKRKILSAGDPIALLLCSLLIMRAVFFDRGRETCNFLGRSYLRSTMFIGTSLIIFVFSWKTFLCRQHVASSKKIVFLDEMGKTILGASFSVSRIAEMKSKLFAQERESTFFLRGERGETFLSKREEDWKR